MPFICSLSGDNGIMGCHEIPPLKEQGRECCLSKDDVFDFGAGRPDLNASGLCVNWNRYYNVCRTGSANPHKGAINFDNIGYAWIVIFQVSCGPEAGALGGVPGCRGGGALRGSWEGKENSGSFMRDELKRAQWRKFGDGGVPAVGTLLCDDCVCTHICSHVCLYACVSAHA